MSIPEFNRISSLEPDNSSANSSRQDSAPDSLAAPNSLTEWWHASGHPAELTPVGNGNGAAALSNGQIMQAGLLNFERNRMAQNMRGQNGDQNRALQIDKQFRDKAIAYAKSHLGEAPEAVKEGYVEREMAHHENRKPNLSQDQLTSVNAWDRINHNDPLSQECRRLIEARSLLFQRRVPEAEKLLLTADKKSPIDSLKWGESILDGHGKLNAQAIDLKMSILEGTLRDNPFQPPKPYERPRHTEFANKDFLAILERSVSGRALSKDELKYLAEDSAFQAVILHRINDQGDSYKHLSAEQKVTELQREVTESAAKIKNGDQPDMARINDLLKDQVNLYKPEVKAPVPGKVTDGGTAKSNQPATAVADSSASAVARNASATYTNPALFGPLPILFAWKKKLRIIYRKFLLFVHWMVNIIELLLMIQVNCKIRSAIHCRLKPSLKLKLRMSANLDLVSLVLAAQVLVLLVVAPIMSVTAGLV